jgi:hypothetical protein
LAATINYDEPVNGTLAVDGTNAKLPLESRNFSRDRLSTVSGTITLDNSYPTGGYGTFNKFGLKAVNGVIFESANGYMFYYNKSTDKIQAYTASGTEVSAATNLSTLPAVYFEAKGRQY